MALSTNTYTYAGGAQTFAVNFALGFIQRSDVTVRVNNAVDGSGDPAYVAIEWIDDSAVTVLDPLTIGDTVEVLRTVSKEELKVNFTAGADITPSNLDLSALQGLMLYQELVDGRVQGTESPLIAADRAEAGALAAEAAATAAAASEAGVNADATAAAASAAAALVSENAAAAVLALTSADAAATAADLVQTNIDQLTVAADKAAAAASAGAAAASETSAAGSEAASAASAASAAMSFDDFQDIYLGAKAAEPTVDNDGDSLVSGALFFDTTRRGMYVYDGTGWVSVNPGTDAIKSSELTDLAAVKGLDQGVATTDSPTFANSPAPKNLIINGGFDVWQRASSQISSGYGSDDRWGNTHTGSTKVHSRQALGLGNTMNGSPQYFSRTVVTSVAGAGNFTIKTQRVEDVSKTAGKTVTMTFWAKADANKNMVVELFQIFGSGGSPSSSVFVPSQTVSLTTSWAKHSLTFVVPSVAGKTRGTNGNDYLAVQFWFDAGSSFNSRTNSLGQQSGTFDIARVSLCGGDVTALDDPFEERTYGEELALCQRYYEKGGASGVSYASSGTAIQRSPVYFNTTKRAVPTIAVTKTGGAATGGSATNPFSQLNGFTLGFGATASSQEWAGEFTADAEL